MVNVEAQAVNWYRACRKKITSAAVLAEKPDLLSETTMMMMMMMRIAACTRLTGDKRPIDEVSTLRARLLALPVERYPALQQMRLIPAL